MDDLITIGELGKRSGVATSALRFYEERGLIRSLRTGANHRRFPRAVIRRVAFIVFAQRIGLTLEEIGAELGKLPASKVPKQSDWMRLSSGWRARVGERIRALETLRDSVAGCIGCGCLSLEKCRLANPRDQLGELGPGPAMWNGGLLKLKQQRARK